MKKLLFVLVCAASLGFWMSCNNGAQELDVTLHGGSVEKSYVNYGKVTATKVTMVTKQTTTKVTYDDNYRPNNKPAGDKEYYPGVVYKANSDGVTTYDGMYWFYNEWDAGTEVTFEVATVSWSDNINYSEDGIVKYEDVKNGKYYNFNLENRDDVTGLLRQYRLLASGNIVTPQYNTYTDYNWGESISQDFSTAPLNVDGSLEGNFTINGSLKCRDWCYNDYKTRRFDVRIDSDGDKIEPYAGVYYLKDVKFTKN